MTSCPKCAHDPGGVSTPVQNAIRRLLGMRPVGRRCGHEDEAADLLGPCYCRHVVHAIGA